MTRPNSRASRTAKTDRAERIYRALFEVERPTHPIALARASAYDTTEEVRAMVRAIIRRALVETKKTKKGTR
jgi:hypothetical protein